MKLFALIVFALTLLVCSMCWMYYRMEDLVQSDGSVRDMGWLRVIRSDFIVNENGSNYLTKLDIPRTAAKHAVDELSPGRVPDVIATGKQIDAPIMDEIEYLFKLGVDNPSLLVNVLLNNSFVDIRDGVAIEHSGMNLNLFESSVHTSDFVCPPDNRRIESTKMFNSSRSLNFKYSNSSYWIFYQHLRKAGGTGFCELARSNMKKGTVPPYYCMPDNKGALATPPWNNQDYLWGNMAKHGFRIASNEWDSFQAYHLQWKNAVFVTTFREPVERWYSQYKFEHLERRDGQAANMPRKPMIQWYHNNHEYFMGSNYYIKTFMGVVDQIDSSTRLGDFYWTYKKFRKYKIQWRDFLTALDTIRKFNLILVLDMLDDSNTGLLLERVLGWRKPPIRVRPHDKQAPKREEDAMQIPLGGSSASHKIPHDDYIEIATDNALDMLFYKVIRRIYLERYACGMYF